MGSEKEHFPDVQGGGSLILAWQIKGKKVLVVGGGEARKPPLRNPPPPNPKFGSVTTSNCLARHA